MQNRYDSQSEAEILKSEFLVNIKPFEADLVANYLAQGFDQMCLALELHDEFYKNALFDYLVFEKGVIALILKQNRQFFVEMIFKGQGNLIRKILALQGRKYRGIWKEVLELLAELSAGKFLEVKQAEQSFQLFLALQKQLFKSE